MPSQQVNTPGQVVCGQLEVQIGEPILLPVVGSRHGPYCSQEHSCRNRCTCCTGVDSSMGCPPASVCRRKSSGLHKRQQLPVISTNTKVHKATRWYQLLAQHKGTQSHKMLPVITHLLNPCCNSQSHRIVPSPNRLHQSPLASPISRSQVMKGKKNAHS